MKRFIFLAISLVIIAGLIVLIRGIFHSKLAGSIVTPTPSLVASPSVTAISNDRYNTIDYNKLKNPATCSIGGTITFTDHDTSRNNQAKLVYSGIDSAARQIIWVITPKDNLRVGPNIAAGLNNLPDGSDLIGVVLPTSPLSPRYMLSVSMTY